MDVPIDFLRHLVVLESHAQQRVPLVSLAEHADQAMQVEAAVLTAQADTRHLDREVILGNDRRVPAAVNLVSDPVDVDALLIVLQLRSSVRERRAEPILDTVAASLQFGLEPGGIVDGVGGTFFGGQAGSVQLLGFDHPDQSFAEVSRCAGVVTRLRPIVQALGAVEPCLDDLEKLDLLDQPDVNEAVDPEPGIGSVSWNSQPSVAVARADDQPQQRKQLEVLSPLGKTCSSDQFRRRRGSRPKDAPTCKVVGLYLEPANDSGDSNLDDASGNCWCQEFTCEGLFLGLRQSFKCLANPLG